MTAQPGTVSELAALYKLWMLAVLEERHPDAAQEKKRYFKALHSLEAAWMKDVHEIARPPRRSTS